MVMTRGRLANASLLFLLIVLALGAGLLLPKHLRLNEARVPQQVIAPVTCDIKAVPCINRHGDLEVRFGVNGEIIGSYQPLQFNVEVSGQRHGRFRRRRHVHGHQPAGPGREHGR